MYKKRTSFFGIPVPAPGDKIRSDDEMTKARIIENQLLAASKGAFCVVYEDGQYTWAKGADGLFTVRCASYGGKPALMGVLNCGLAQTYSTIKWSGLNPGKKLFLYVEWSPTLYEVESSFLTMVQPTIVPQTNKNMLMATIDLSDPENPVLDTNPDGKLYVKDFSQHIGDNLNPHTPLLIQDKLVVRRQLRVETIDPAIDGGVLVFDDQRGEGEPQIESKGELIIKDIRAKVSLSDDSNPALATTAETIFGAINEVARREKVMVVSSPYGGPAGMTIIVEGAIEILGVSVTTNRGEAPAGVGDVEVGYFNQDVEVESPEMFRVYNSGGIGGRFRAVVAYR